MLVGQIKLLSIAKIFVRKLLRKEPGRPEFSWRGGGEPEQVDYAGAMNQMEAAAAAGVKQFVFLGSMGGTDPSNFLNTIGKRPDGTGGDILLWKRKAEKHLVKLAQEKGFAYTIVHPGESVSQSASDDVYVLTRGVR